MEEDGMRGTWWSPEKKRKRMRETTREGKIMARIRKMGQKLLSEEEKAVAVRPQVAPLNDAVSKNVHKQVESYFSDNNLLSEKFLANSINGSDDGLVSLTLICSRGGGIL